MASGRARPRLLPPTWVQCGLPGGVRVLAPTWVQCGLRRGVRVPAPTWAQCGSVVLASGPLVGSVRNVRSCSPVELRAGSIATVRARGLGWMRNNHTGPVWIVRSSLPVGLRATSGPSFHMLQPPLGMLFASDLRCTSSRGRRNHPGEPEAPSPQNGRPTASPWGLVQRVERNQCSSTLSSKTAYDGSWWRIDA